MILLMRLSAEGVYALLTVLQPVEGDILDEDDYFADKSWFDGAIGNF